MTTKATDQADIAPSSDHDPKTGNFLPGNKWVGKSPGRPRTIERRIRDENALKLLRSTISENLDLEAAVKRMIENAFFVEKKNGQIGDVTWAKLLLSYAVGLPPTKVESTHTNLVDMVRLMVEKNITETVVDGSVTNVDDG